MHSPDDDQSLWQVLAKSIKDEADLVEKAYREHGTVEWRRIYIRSVFSALEYLCSVAMNVAYWKMMNVATERIRPGLFDPKSEEDAFILTSLRYKQFEIQENGKVKEKAAKVNLTRRILFIFRTFARLRGKEFDPRNEAGWKDLQIAILVRDRITHPKSNEHLYVTPEEAEHAGAALKWFVASLKESRRKVK
jgi:hypothetical protein